MRYIRLIIRHPHDISLILEELRDLRHPNHAVNIQYDLLVMFVVRSELPTGISVSVVTKHHKTVVVFMSSTPTNALIYNLHGDAEVVIFPLLLAH